MWRQGGPGHRGRRPVGGDLVLQTLGSQAEVWRHIQIGVCWRGQHRGGVECGLQAGAETCSQATAIVQAEEGRACAKWQEEEQSVPKALLTLKSQEGPQDLNLSSVFLGFSGL